MAFTIAYDLERATLADFIQFASAQAANKLSLCVPFINTVVTEWDFEFDPSDPELATTLPVGKFSTMARLFLNQVGDDISGFELSDGVDQQITVELDRWTWADLENYQDAGIAGDYDEILKMVQQVLVNAPFPVNEQMNLETEFLPLMGVVRAELGNLFQ